MGEKPNIYIAEGYILLTVGVPEEKHQLVASH
jgi:hypothetical protein